MKILPTAICAILLSDGPAMAEQSIKPKDWVNCSRLPGNKLRAGEPPAASWPIPASLDLGGIAVGSKFSNRVRLEIAAGWSY
jgi:hypothetical protein